MTIPAETVQMTAYALGSECDINRLSREIGSGSRLGWEDPLVLNCHDCTLAEEFDSAGGMVYLYHFGSIVFAGCQRNEIAAFFARFRRQLGLSDEKPAARHKEEYSLAVGNRSGDDALAVTEINSDAIAIACLVLAKSVALERIEEGLEQVQDEVEPLIRRLESGRLSIPDRELARLAAKILDYRYRSISHVMVLDKPESAWDSNNADRLHQRLADNFEISLRYQRIRQKSETILGITEIFTGLSHARRSARLEWIIILLIAAEIILSIYRG